MRFVIAAVAVAIVVPSARAQPLPPITATPLMPSTTQPSLVAPLPSGQRQTAPQQTPPAAPRPTQPSWLPQGSAQLQVLDKVNAQNAVLTVKVGQGAQYGSLAIQVQACDIRPPDQPRDFAAYLTITDSHADAPGFSGWMLANNPSLSMLQHPIYDVRVVGCKT
jgi:hypothetical protein